MKVWVVKIFHSDRDEEPDVIILKSEALAGELKLGLTDLNLGLRIDVSKEVVEETPKDVKGIIREYKELLGD